MIVYRHTPWSSCFRPTETKENPSQLMFQASPSNPAYRRTVKPRHTNNRMSRFFPYPYWLFSTLHRHPVLSEKENGWFLCGNHKPKPKCQVLVRRKRNIRLHNKNRKVPAIFLLIPETPQPRKYFPPYQICLSMSLNPCLYKHTSKCLTINTKKFFYS